MPAACFAPATGIASRVRVGRGPDTEGSDVPANPIYTYLTIVIDTMGS
jgi:hypothetical protein